MENKCIYCIGQCLKNGHDRKGRQRFRCVENDCRRTFYIPSTEELEVISEKRLVIHLLISGCNVNQISKSLNIEENLIVEWQKIFLPKIKLLSPGKSLLAIDKLIDIYKAIEKRKISKIHQVRKQRF